MQGFGVEMLTRWEKHSLPGWLPAALGQAGLQAGSCPLLRRKFCSLAVGAAIPQSPACTP